MKAAAAPTNRVSELPRPAAPLLGVIVAVGAEVLLAVPVLLEPEPAVVVALPGRLVKVEMGRMLPDEVILPTGAMVVMGAATVVVVISTVDREVTTAEVDKVVTATDVAVALAVMVVSAELVATAPIVKSGVSLLSLP